MGSRKGTLLEENVYRMFSLAGFNPKRNVVVSGYEIDVYIRHKNIELIIECKQYERSALSVRNVLHEWDSKKKIIKPTKVLIIAIGIDISKSDYELARRFNIAIWGDEKFTRLMDDAISKKSKIREKLLAEIGIKLEPTSPDLQIINLMRNYYCNVAQADKYLKGELLKNDLINIKKEYLATIEKHKEILSNNDERMLKNNKYYRNVPFRDIFRCMIKYNIGDKKLARMLIVGNTSIYKHRRYYKRELQKMILLMDELGYTFEQVNKVDFNKYTMKQVRDKIYQLKSNNITIFNENEWYLLSTTLENQNNLVETINNTEQDVRKDYVIILKIFAVLGIIIAIFVLSVLIFSLEVVLDAILTIIIVLIFFFYIILKFSR